MSSPTSAAAQRAHRSHVPGLDGRAADLARIFLILAMVGSFCSPPLANIGAALALIAFFASPGAWPHLRAAALRPAGIGALVLLATMALAMLWADAPWPRRLSVWWSWRPLMLLLLAGALFEEPRWKDRFALWVVGALVLATLASFVLRLLGASPVAVDEPGILLRNHTTQGMALVIGVILAVVLGWGRPASALRRRALAAAIVLMVANIALVVTGRSAHLALLVAAAVVGFSLVPGRRRWLAPVAIVLLGAALLASSSMVRQRFETAYSEFDARSSPTETSMGIRKVVWDTTWHLIERRPVLGYGVGGFAPAYALYVHEHYTGWEAQEAKDTHNQFLHVWVEAGIPGLLAFLAFVAGVCRQPVAAPYRGAALGLLAAWLATSLLNSHFQTFAEAHLIGLALGVLLGTPMPAPRTAPGAPQPSTSAAATAAATSP
jgi:O-antigen ligase